MNNFAAYKGAVLFIGKVLLLYVCWDFLYLRFIRDSGFDYWVTTLLAKTSAGMLTVSGFNAVVLAGNTVYIDEMPLVFIGGACNGIDFFGLFTCFVLAYPARLWHKVWFIPMGILAIHLLNTIRVFLLALNLWYSRESFDFNHKYTFILLLYGIIFLLWRYWTKRFANAVL